MNHEKDGSIETLIKLAGERDMPTPAAMERARAAAAEAWRATLQEPDRVPGRSHRAWLALAASILLAAWGAWHWARPQAVRVAQVVAVIDHAQLSGPREGLPQAGDEVLSGALLETATGRVALAIGASSLRVDAHTRLRFEAADLVSLMEGAVYVDSGGVNSASSLRIRTPAGEVRHLGTQFQVGVTAGRTRVQVREGRVVITNAAQTHEVAAGEMLEVTRAGATLTRARPGFGAAWEWITQAAPAFDIENRPLAEFLTWIAREHGWQLRYTDASQQSRAQSVRLHGSLGGLDAAGMVERVALITGTPISLREDALTIGAPSP